MNLRTCLLALLVSSFGISCMMVNTSGLVHAQGLRPRRMRKNWDAYTQEEKDLYLGAVQRAMEGGHQYRFALLHSQPENDANAHGNCGFLLWHRRYLLGYENMLRSMGPEYAEVTLPVWNYFRDVDMIINNEIDCWSLGQCSTLLRDFGGGGDTDESVGEEQSIGDAVMRHGTCVRSGIAGHACASEDGMDSGTCDQCIMRGDWDRKGFPVNHDFASFFQHDGHASLSRRLEGGFHADIHNALGGVMATMSSPFDPVFFAHHTTIDFTLYVLNHCVYDPHDQLDPDSTSTTFFNIFDTCSAGGARGTTERTITGDSEMHMSLDGVRVEEVDSMAPFFSDLDADYSTYADPMSLGQQSFGYELDPYLEEFLRLRNIKCPSFMRSNTNDGWARRKLRRTQDDTDGDGHPHRYHHHHHHRHQHHHHHQHGHQHQQQRQHRHQRQRQHQHQRNKNHETIQTDQLQQVTWQTQAALGVAQTLADCGEQLLQSYPDLTPVDRLEQEAIVKCEIMRQRNKEHFVDYSDVFRKEFRVPVEQKPYCLALFDRVKTGELHVLVSDQCRQQMGSVSGVNLVDSFLFKSVQGILRGKGNHGQVANATSSARQHMRASHHAHVRFHKH